MKKSANKNCKKKKKNDRKDFRLTKLNGLDETLYHTK